jgi:hypothetical protein
VKKSFVHTSTGGVGFSKAEKDNPLITKELLTTPPPGHYEFSPAINMNKGVTIGEKR